MSEESVGRGSTGTRLLLDLLCIVTAFPVDPALESLLWQALRPNPTRAVGPVHAVDLVGTPELLTGA